MTKINLEKIKKVHLIGIGGIGVSAIARILFKKSLQVSGSDLQENKVTQNLNKLGIRIHLGLHKAENLEKDTDLVIYTTAIKKNNPELLKAKRLKIPVLSYPEMLGELTKNHFTVAVAGTHGKTTTAALISLVLEESGLDPTVVLGSNLKKFKGNARIGKSNYFVIEADEYKYAFLSYNPRIIVLTSIEYEHPDCFKNINQVKNAFSRFIRKLPKDGIVVACYDDGNVRDVVEKIERKVITYGFTDGAEFRISGFVTGKKKNKFQLFRRNDLLGDFKISIPGRHNVLNATAAAVVGLELGTNIGNTKKAIEEYKGAWRRFEIKEKINNITIIDDYAHHPTEIKVTLKAAREKFGDRRIICVFQPHQYKRTKALFSDFIGVFEEADQIIMPEIYKVVGREEDVSLVSSEQLVKEIKKRGKNALFLPKLSQVVNYLVKHIRRDDIILIMGAGDVTKVGDKLIEELKKTAE